MVETETQVLTAKNEVNEKIVAKYKAFIFDMDGVIWRLNDPIEGAKEALQTLCSLGKHIFFVTNNSTMQSTLLAEKLRHLNLGSFPEHCILASSWAAAQYLKSTGCKGKVYVIGPPSLYYELEKIPDITIVDSSIHNNKICTPHEFFNTEIDSDIEAVVMGFDKYLNYYKIAYVSALLNMNPMVHLIFTNVDHQFPTAKYILPGTGALISPVQLATGRTGVIAGKPGPLMINEVLRQYPELSSDDICIVGDNLTTDIPFANKNGICSVLVETGVHKREDIEKCTKNGSGDAPRYVIPSISFFNP